MIRKEEVVQIGRFAKPHGVKGELSLLASSGAFDEMEEPYLLCEIDGILVPFFIEEYKDKSGSVVLVKLENVDSDRAASELTNLEVYVPGNIIKNLPLEESEWSYFIGFHLTDEHQGDLGPIEAVDESTLNVLWKVDYKGEELLIPVVAEWITSVDHEKKRIRVDLPDGLLTLSTQQTDAE